MTLSTLPCPWRKLCVQSPPLQSKLLGLHGLLWACSGMGGTEESLFAICNKVFILDLALTVSVMYNVTSHIKKTTHIPSRHTSRPWAIPLQARKSPRRPNNLDCSGGLWTQSFRQGYGNVDKIRVSCSLGAACHLR